MDHGGKHDHLPLSPLARMDAVVPAAAAAALHPLGRTSGATTPHGADPQAVVDYLYGSLRDRKTEVFKVLFLNKSNRIVDEADLFHGTVDETAVHCREVVKSALERHATALILVHNHPSGRIQPSAEDREITEKLKAACGAVSVKVLDHVIIGDNQHFSFTEHNLL